MEPILASTGERSPFQGKWVCTSCGEELRVMKDEALPPCPHENEDVKWEALSAVAETVMAGPGAPTESLRRDWEEDGGRAP